MQYETAYIFGSAIGFMLWGFYTCLFVVTIWAVHVQGIDKWTSPVMFALITLYILNLVINAINLTNLYYYFVAPLDDLTNALNILPILWDAASTFTLLIADGVLCWRLWVIRMRDYRIMIILGLALLAQLGSDLAVIAIDIMIETRGATHTRWAQYRSSAGLTIYLSLGITLMVTGLIVVKLWQANRRAQSSPNSCAAPRGPYIKVILALVESGMLYTLFMIPYVISFRLGDGTAQFFFTNSLPVIVAIVPTLIQLQRSIGYLQPSETPVLSKETTRASSICFACQTQVSTYPTLTGVGVSEPLKLVRNSHSEKAVDLVL